MKIHHIIVLLTLLWPHRHRWALLTSNELLHQ